MTWQSHNWSEVDPKSSYLYSVLLSLFRTVSTLALTENVTGTGHDFFIRNYTKSTY